MARLPRGQGLDEIAALHLLLTVDEIAAFHHLVAALLDLLGDHKTRHPSRNTI